MPEFIGWAINNSDPANLIVLLAVWYRIETRLSKVESAAKDNHPEFFRGSDTER